MSEFAGGKKKRKKGGKNKKKNSESSARVSRSGTCSESQPFDADAESLVARLDRRVDPGEPESQPVGVARQPLDSTDGRPRIEIRRRARIVSKRGKGTFSSRTGLRVSALGVEYHFRAVDELP